MVLCWVQLQFLEGHMADKTAHTIKLNVRFPPALHKRLKQQARRNNVSLNTEIVNQLSGTLATALGDDFWENVGRAVRKEFLRADAELDAGRPEQEKDEEQK
jgi:hypothetical protein